MLNFEKWKFYTKNFSSPESWIDFGWWFLISACLQRRVWLYDDVMPVYPNQYVVFVGPPGKGKGLVIGAVADMLRYHRYEKGQLIKTSIGQEYPPLFPTGADSITFEKLLPDLADSARRIVTPDNKVYMHCSYAFPLEEMASLFKHKTADVIKFLQNAYDCKPYEYKTKGQGMDVLRNICLSFLAGTQPDFLKEASEAHIFGQGFASRALFLFEDKERQSRFHISEFSADQKQAREDLLAWIKELSTLYGKVTYDQDTYDFLEEWYRTSFIPGQARAHPKMADYWSRKKIIMIKLAMAMHFSESKSMVIPCETFKAAIAAQEAIEPQMTKGFCATGRNTLHGYANKILEFVRSTNGASKAEIILAFASELNMTEVDDCIGELEAAYGLRRNVKDGRYYVI